MFLATDIDYVEFIKKDKTSQVMTVAGVNLKLICK